jgi:hypothetical protein
VSLYIKLSKVDLPIENQTPKIWYSDVSGVQMVTVLDHRLADFLKLRKKRQRNKTCSFSNGTLKCAKSKKLKFYFSSLEQTSGFFELVTFYRQITLSYWSLLKKIWEGMSINFFMPLFNPACSEI